MSIADKLPDFINEILNEYKCYFAGSSLIHDVYFPDENWGERDYDIWCDNENFDKINLKLCTSGNVPIRMEYFKKIGDYQKSIAISEYNFENKKLQLINIGNNKFSCYDFDFTFLRCYYDGKNFKHYYEEHLKNKVGFIERFDNNSINRIDKYVKRGFKFLNLCFYCLKNENQINNRDYSEKKFFCRNCFNDNFNSLSLENELRIISNENYLIKNYLLDYLFTLIKMKKIDRFKEILERIKDELNNDQIFRLLNFLGKLNLTESFIYTFELVKQLENKYIYEMITSLINKKCGGNCILYLEKKIYSLYLDKIEDHIISFRFLNNLELAHKNKDIIHYYLELQLEKGTNEEDCPVCKIEKTNIKLNCGHYFCSKCLYKIIFESDISKKCGICRSPLLK